MSDDVRAELGRLSTAEEFLDYFGVEYEQGMVNVNRLHILKRFHQYLRATPVQDGAELRALCKVLLERAYQDFVRSTPAAEKVFKVFQDQSVRSVALDGLRRSLPSRRNGE